MTVSDETLMLYADGELDSGARAAVENAIAGDATLAARVARYRAERDRLRAAYAPILEEVVPARLLGAIESAPPPRTTTAVDLTGRRAARSMRQRVRDWSWPEWGAIAASLLIGLLVTQLQSSRVDSSLVRLGPEGMVAGRTLETALSKQLASAQSPDAPIHVGVTFENASGQLCRTFTAQGAPSWSGLACFATGEWRLGMAIENPPGSAAQSASNTTRMASSEMPPALLRAVTDQIRGEPLDADAERAARDRGWRR